MVEDLIEVLVQRIQLDQASRPYVVLVDRARLRMLPIPIGWAEATSIHFKLERRVFPRPLTHDLIANVLQGLRAPLERVVVTRLRDGTFYALLDVASNSGVHSIDARPSDAIAIALRAKARIFVASAVMEAAGRSYSDLLPEMPDCELSEADAGPARQREIEQFIQLLQDLNTDEEPVG